MQNKLDRSAADRACYDGLAAVSGVHDAQCTDFKFKAQYGSPTSGMNTIAAARKITGSASQGITSGHSG